MLRLAVVFDKNDIRDLVQETRSPDYILPMTFALWETCRATPSLAEKILPIWELRQYINYQVLDSKFPQWDAAWSQYIGRKAEALPQILTPEAVYYGSRINIWVRQRESQFVIALIEQAINHKPDIKTLIVYNRSYTHYSRYYRAGRSGFYATLAATRQLGLKLEIKNKYESSNVESSGYMSPTTGQFAAKKSGLAVITYAMPNLGFHLKRIAIQNRYAVFYVGPYFAGRSSELADLAKPYKNVQIVTYDTEPTIAWREDKNKVNSYDYRGSEEDLIDINLDDILNYDLPFQAALTQNLLESLGHQKPDEILMADHDGYDAQATIHYTQNSQTPLSLMAHSLWPLKSPFAVANHSPNRYITPTHTFFHEKTRSQKKTQQGSKKILLPPDTLEFNMRRRVKLLSHRLDRVIRKTAPINVGCILTPGMTHVSSDIDLMEILRPLKVLAEAMKDFGLLWNFRIRDQELSKVYLEHLLETLGLFTEASVKFDYVSRNPANVFIDKCDFFLELGVASSLSLEAIALGKPCVRLKPQKPKLLRFNNRGIDVIKIEDFKTILCDVSKRRALWRRQYALLKKDVTPGKAG